MLRCILRALAQHRPQRASGRDSHGVIITLCCTAVSLDAQGAQKAAAALRSASSAVAGLLFPRTDGASLAHAHAHEFVVGYVARPHAR
jgi:hypothetical protein